MNNSTPDSNQSSNQNSSTSKTDPNSSVSRTEPKNSDQKSSSSQSNTSPQNIGGDQKNESKTDVVKENKNVTAR